MGRTKLHRLIMAIMISLIIAGSAVAAPDVSIDGAWCRPSPERKDTAFVYMTLSLKGAPDEQLVGAATAIAQRAELLSPRDEKGRRILDSVLSIALDSHSPTILEPEGPHIILHGVKHRLVPGESFLITLEFADAGRRDARVTVLKQPPGFDAPKLPKGVKLD